MYLIRSITRKAMAIPESPFVLRLLAEHLYRRHGIGNGSERLDLSDVERVLIVRLDKIGDIILSTPLLRELRGNMPGAYITLVVDPIVHNLIETCPYVDEVLTFSSARDRCFASFENVWRAFWICRRHLWPHRFDLAVLPRWNCDVYTGTLLAYLSISRHRIGFSAGRSGGKRDAGLFNSDDLLTHVLRDEHPKHEVERHLDLLRLMGGEVRDDSLEFWLRADDERFAEGVFAPPPVSTHAGPVIALGPGAGHPHRRWPLSHFASLGRWLVERWQARILILGSRDEEHLGKGLAGDIGHGALDMAGKTTLRQALACLRRCDLYIGNDSGLMHMAAAAGIPVVEISSFPSGGSPSHYNSPVRFGPWKVPGHVLQPVSTPPCSDGCSANEAHCIMGVSCEQVMNAVRSILSSRASGGF